MSTRFISLDDIDGLTLALTAAARLGFSDSALHHRPRTAMDVLRALKAGFNGDDGRFTQVGQYRHGHTGGLKAAYSAGRFSQEMQAAKAQEKRLEGMPR